jgi:hypothetical protein
MDSHAAIKRMIGNGVFYAVLADGIGWESTVEVRQLPASKDVSMEAEDIVGIWYQAVTDEDIANWEDLLWAVVRSRVCKLVRVL